MAASVVTILSAVGVYLAFPEKVDGLISALFGLAYLSTLVFKLPPKAMGCKSHFFNQSPDTMLVVGPATQEIVACNNQAVPAFGAKSEYKETWG